MLKQKMRKEKVHVLQVLIVLTIDHDEINYNTRKRENENIQLKARFLLFQVYRYFANLFSKLSVSTFYKEISKFQQKVQS